MNLNPLLAAQRSNPRQRQQKGYFIVKHLEGMGYNIRKSFQSHGGRRVLVIALIWAALTLGLAYALRGTPNAGFVVILASAAAVVSIMRVSRRRGGDGRTA